MDEEELLRLIADDESYRDLVEAFTRIEDRETRERLIALVNEVAEGRLNIGKLDGG
jgi:hypothetical protein